MESKDLTVVIVTFNSEAKIINCLKNIPSDVRIIVVENSDNEKLKKDLEYKFKNLSCILTGDNKGYAAANNIGLNQVNTTHEGKPQMAWRPKHLYHYIQWNDAKPDFVVDISAHIETKLEAVNAYASQFFNPKAVCPRPKNR